MSKTPLSLKEKDALGNEKTIYIETENLKTLNIFYSTMHKEEESMICLGMSYYDKDSSSSGNRIKYREVIYSFDEMQLCLDDFKDISLIMRGE